MKKGLGKGLDALFEENTFDIADKPVTEADINDIEPRKTSPAASLTRAAGRAGES